METTANTAPTYTKATLHKGMEVICNGYRGHIYEIHDGQLDGMVTVDMGRGQVCVAISDLGK